MSGTRHYREAEKLLKAAEDIYDDAALHHLLAAGVHATLALAAAQLPTSAVIDEAQRDT